MKFYATKIVESEKEHSVQLKIGHRSLLLKVGDHEDLVKMSYYKKAKWLQNQLTKALDRMGNDYYNLGRWS